MSYSIDPEFDAAVKPLSWSRSFGRSRKYWGTHIKGKCVLMHRLVWELKNGSIPPSKRIDHKDRDPSNNTVANLRLVDASTNQANRGKQSNNTSGYIGVCWYPPLQKWHAQIKKHRRCFHLGYHPDKISAARAVNAAYRRLFPVVPIPNPSAE